MTTDQRQPVAADKDFRSVGNDPWFAERRVTRRPGHFAEFVRLAVGPALAMKVEAEFIVREAPQALVSRPVDRRPEILRLAPDKVGRGEQFGLRLGSDGGHRPGLRHAAGHPEVGAAEPAGTIRSEYEYRAVGRQAWLNIQSRAIDRRTEVRGRDEGDLRRLPYAHEEVVCNTVAKVR